MGFIVKFHNGNIQVLIVSSFFLYCFGNLGIIKWLQMGPWFGFRLAPSGYNFIFLLHLSKDIAYVLYTFSVGRYCHRLQSCCAVATADYELNIFSFRLKLDILSQS